MWPAVWLYRSTKVSSRAKLHGSPHRECICFALFNFQCSWGQKVMRPKLGRITPAKQQAGKMSLTYRQSSG